MPAVPDTCLGGQLYDMCVYSTFNFVLKERPDFGQYCCILWNGFERDDSCVNIYYFPTDYHSLDNLQLIVYCIMSSLILSFTIIIPLSFMRRISQNVTFHKIEETFLITNFSRFLDEIKN